MAQEEEKYIQKSHPLLTIIIYTENASNRSTRQCYYSIEENIKIYCTVSVQFEEVTLKFHTYIWIFSS